MESYSICEWLGDKMKIPLHLYDTWGLRIVHGFESGLVGLAGGGGDLNNVVYNCVERCGLFNDTSSFKGWPSRGQQLDLLDLCSVCNNF